MHAGKVMNLGQDASAWQLQELHDSNKTATYIEVQKENAKEGKSESIYSSSSRDFVSEQLLH